MNLMWQKMFSYKPWCLNRIEGLMLQKNLKGKFILFCGIGVSTPYGIDEGKLEIYGFTNEYMIKNDVAI